MTNESESAHGSRGGQRDAVSGTLLIAHALALLLAFSCGTVGLSASAIAQAPSTQAKQPAFEADPMDRYRTFQQRPCSGTDDCERANVEAEQTAASRVFNLSARTSMAAAVQQLGPPTYVLRSGDVVGRPEYAQNPTEMRFAAAIVGWANGACAPNELHVLVHAGQSTLSPQPGGTYCSKDGGAYPLPGNKFACAGGRKGDPLCTMAGLLALPHMSGR